MKRKSNILFTLIFAGVGICAIIMGIQQMKDNKKFYAEAETVTARIDDIEVTKTTSGTGKKRKTKTDHDVFVTYTVEGVEYKHIEIGEYSSGMSVGDTLTLHYDPSNPKDVRYKEVGESGPKVAIALGVVFALVGISISFIGSGFSMKKKLIKTGVRCISDELYIDQNTSVRVNGRCPYVIYCRLQDPTGEYRECKSKNIYENLDRYDIRRVDVYFDQKNPKKYYVDVEGAMNNSDKRYY